MQGLAITIALSGIVFSILWVVIAWRAMKAHEALATEAKNYNARMSSLELMETKRELTDQKKLYNKFIRENPEVDNLSSKERHLRFRDWLEGHSS